MINPGDTVVLASGKRAVVQSVTADSVQLEGGAWVLIRDVVKA